MVFLWISLWILPLPYAPCLSHAPWLTSNNLRPWVHLPAPSSLEEATTIIYHPQLWVMARNTCDKYLRHLMTPFYRKYNPFFHPSDNHTHNSWPWPFHCHPNLLQPPPRPLRRGHETLARVPKELSEGLSEHLLRWRAAPTCAEILSWLRSKQP